MGKLSLAEFRSRLNSTPSNKLFVFSANNQKWHNTESTLGLELVFEKIVITFCPNTIFLSDKANNSMKFSRVRAVVEDEPCPLGNVFTVVCGNKDSEGGEKEYTIIVRQKN